MMLSYYDHDGNITSQEHWEMLMEDRLGRRVAADTVGDYWVSTVWLGIDHGFGDGPPVLWETMIFAKGQGDPLNLDCWEQRYTSRKDAVEGHAKVVQQLKEESRFDI